MLKHLIINEAQEQLADLPYLVRQEPVMITQNGQPVMAATSYQQLMEMLETLAVLSDRAFASNLHERAIHGAPSQCPSG